MENQPTKLDKAVKISIIVGALTVGLSVAYYLVIYIPQRDKEKMEQQKAQQQVKTETDTAKAAQAQSDKEAAQTEIYRKECTTQKDENVQKYTEFINTCTGAGGNSIDYCMNSPAGRLLAKNINNDFISTCVDAKKKLIN